LIVKASCKLTVGLLPALLGGCMTPSSGLGVDDFEFDASQPIGLITGYAVHQRLRGIPACPADWICMDVVYEIRLDDAELIAGSTGASLTTVWDVRHTEAPGTPQMAFIVQKAKDGRLWARADSVVSEGKACFSRSSWERHRGLLQEARAVPDEEGVCVAVNG
jgi:hypothetical protein